MKVPLNDTELRILIDKLNKADSLDERRLQHKLTAWLMTPPTNMTILEMLNHA